MTQHIRAVPAILGATSRNGQRFLTGRLVPYGVVADVLDEVDGKREFYREGFRPGAFRLQAGPTVADKLSKIGLRHTHERGGGLGYLGPFVALRDEPDGLYGDARIMPTLVDNVEALLESGVDELSIEFGLSPRATNTEVGADGVRWRTRAHLLQVALEPMGAYSTAQVLAFRAEADELAKEEAAAAEAAQAEEAAKQAEADAEALASAEERRRVEAAAEAAEARHRRWVELTDRIDGEMDRQKRYLADLGLTVPGGFKRDVDRWA